jgi:hypothetical protein
VKDPFVSSRFEKVHEPIVWTCWIEVFVVVVVHKIDDELTAVAKRFDQPGHVRFERGIVALGPSRTRLEGILNVDYQQSVVQLRRFVSSHGSGQQ